MFDEPSPEAKDNLAKRNSQFFNLHVDRLNKAREAKANRAARKLGEGAYNRW